jgi:hypothetical protein
VLFWVGVRTCFLVQPKHKSVSLSSTKVEYMASIQAIWEAIWICKLLVGLFGQELSLTVIHCDNLSCIKLSKNPVFHDKSKNIEIRYHFIKIRFIMG